MTHPPSPSGTNNHCMKKPYVLLCVLPFLFAACDRKPIAEKPVATTANLETARLGEAIDLYISHPTAEQAATVDKSFAELDGEIAELGQRVSQASGAERDEAQAKATNLKTYRAKEQIRFTEAKARAQTQAATDGTKAAGEKIEEGVKKAGEGVKDAAEAVKDGVDHAVDNVKEKLP